jgi:hypothetical protein
MKKFIDKWGGSEACGGLAGRLVVRMLSALSPYQI